MFPQAYDDDHLAELIDSNSSAPDWIDAAAAERIADHARGRADSRGETSAVDETEQECLITTDWNGFVDDWGYAGGNSNQVALGVFNKDASRDKNADLFTDVVVLQSDWLRSGDGRLTQAEQYEDTEWDEATPGEMWIAESAQEYLCIIELTDDLRHGEPEMSDMM